MVVVAAFGVVGNIIFIRLKVLSQSGKKLKKKKKKKKKHSTLNDTVLTNSYRLGFFLFGICQFSI
jgi:large-conductance mechanosensitive channel